MSGQGDPPQAAGVHPGISPLRGGSFRRVLRTQALRTRRAAAHGGPGDRPPAVLAVSRCRARQHHDQADDHAPDAPGAVKMSQRPGRNAAHCPGRPDGEGQARGQARTARGEPPYAGRRHCSFPCHTRMLRCAASRISCASMPTRVSPVPSWQINSSGPLGGSGQAHHRESV
jgi:hypothetical protein